MSLYLNQQKIVPKTFSDGSLEINLSSLNLEEPSKALNVLITSAKSEDVLGLFLLIDLLKQRFFNLPINLQMPYVPYMRSDRNMTVDTSFGIKTFSKLLNLLDLDQVTIYDPHSDVTPALISKVKTIQQHELAFLMLSDQSFDYIISPDAGASKKVLKLSEKMEIPCIEATKVRDLKTNKILKTNVNTLEKLEGLSVLIVDDICEYGSTHRELAKVLKEEHGVKKVSLFVTHGVLPTNSRQNPPSRTSFLEEYIDQMYTYFLWEGDSVNTSFLKSYNSFTE